MSIEQNKTIVRRYYDELWNRWDFQLVDELIAPEIQFRGSLGVAVRGRDEFLKYVAMVRAAFPDFTNTIEDLIAEGDRVMARLTYRGTHRGTLFGVAATQKAIEYGGIALFRIGNGQIVEVFVLGDTTSLWRQLGVRPPG